MDTPVKKKNRPTYDGDASRAGRHAGIPARDRLLFRGLASLNDIQSRSVQTTRHRVRTVLPPEGHAAFGHSRRTAVEPSRSRSHISRTTGMANVLARRCSHRRHGVLHVREVRRDSRVSMHSIFGISSGADSLAVHFSRMNIDLLNVFHSVSRVCVDRDAYVRISYAKGRLCPLSTDRYIGVRCDDY